MSLKHVIALGMLSLAAPGLRAESPIPKEHRVVALTETDKEAIKDFEARMKDYLVLHRKLEATLPKLGKEATPEEIDKNQRALGTLIKSERSDARKGEFFNPGLQDLVRRTLKAVMAGKDGKVIRASIMDENPGLPNLGLNDRYPDEVPLSTMPPQVLEPLPKLDEDLEYRFIGRRLVLLDAHAHIIVDLTDDILP